jgi:N-dimethylarginine dimethylaminohydrolase
MCRPTFYGIAYVINPWMNVRRQPNRPLALGQWEALRKTLRNELGAEVLRRVEERLPLLDHDL